MSDRSEYVAEHIRIALADRGPHQMGLTVHVDADEVRLRGPIDNEADRTAILAIVREHAEGRLVVDDLECPQVERTVRIERLE